MRRRKRADAWRVTRRQRPPLVPRSNRWLVAPALASLALSFHQSGVWWVVGIVGAFVAIRVVLWIASGYSTLASKAIEDREIDPEKVIEPYRRIPVIGWMIWGGARMQGIVKARTAKGARIELVVRTAVVLGLCVALLVGMRH